MDKGGSVQSFAEVESPLIRKAKNANEWGTRLSGAPGHYFPSTTKPCEVVGGRKRETDRLTVEGPLRGCGFGALDGIGLQRALVVVDAHHLNHAARHKSYDARGLHCRSCVDDQLLRIAGLNGDTRSVNMTDSSQNDVTSGRKGRLNSLLGYELDFPGFFARVAMVAKDHEFLVTGDVDFTVGNDWHDVGIAAVGPGACRGLKQSSEGSGGGSGVEGVEGDDALTVWMGNGPNDGIGGPPGKNAGEKAEVPAGGKRGGGGFL